jgi:hypothetical protein
MIFARLSRDHRERLAVIYCDLPDHLCLLWLPFARRYIGFRRPAAQSAGRSFRRSRRGAGWRRVGANGPGALRDEYDLPRSGAECVAGALPAAALEDTGRARAHEPRASRRGRGSPAREDHERYEVLREPVPQSYWRRWIGSQTVGEARKYAVAVEDGTCVRRYSVCCRRAGQTHGGFRGGGELTVTAPFGHGSVTAPDYARLSSGARNRVADEIR